MYGTATPAVPVDVMLLIAMLAAVAPVVRAKSQEMTVALATVFCLNATALLIFPWIGHHFFLSQRFHPPTILRSRREVTKTLILDYISCRTRDFYFLYHVHNLFPAIKTTSGTNGVSSF